MCTNRTDGSYQHGATSDPKLQTIQQLTSNLTQNPKSSNTVNLIFKIISPIIVLLIPSICDNELQVICVEQYVRSCQNLPIRTSRTWPNPSHYSTPKKKHSPKMFQNKPNNIPPALLNLNLHNPHTILKQKPNLITDFNYNLMTWKQKGHRLQESKVIHSN